MRIFSDRKKNLNSLKKRFYITFGASLFFLFFSENLFLTNLSVDMGVPPLIPLRPQVQSGERVPGPVTSIEEDKESKDASVQKGVNFELFQSRLFSLLHN